jgi:serine/threonine protein kinase
MKVESHTASSLLDALPPEQQERLACILDEYLQGVECGRPVSPEALLKRYPADAEYLREYLSGLNLFHAVAVTPSAAGTSLMVGRRAGQTIGDFQLIREIGRGGMGVVYEAVQTSLNRRVALKVLPFSVGHDSKHIARFKHEAQSAAHVQHPHIVPVFAIGEEDGVHYYAMQLIEGQSLAAMVQRRSTEQQLPAAATTISLNQETVCGRQILPPATDELANANADAPERPALTAEETRRHILAVTRLGVQAALALHAAHEFGVIHRDVKPSNLLVDAAGKLWITDFGLARCREGSGLTQSGDVVGTMRYMSPEQAVGRGPLVDHRTDVYSLGVTLYELATFVHPAENASDVQLFYQRMRTSSKPLRHWNRHIPADFETIVLKSMAELPQERYESAEQLADDLQRFLDGKLIAACPPSTLNKFWKWARRHRTAVRAAAGVLLLAAVGVVVSSLLLVRQRTRTATAMAEAFRQATDQIDRNAQLGERLADIPGAEGIRRQLYEQSIHFYRRYAERAQHDPALARELAVTYSKIASLSTKVGNQQQALRFHQDAERLVERLVNAHPGDVAYARDLALCQNNLGLALSELGRSAEALALLRQAEQRQTELLSADPESPQLSADLATTYSNLGLVLTQAGDNSKGVEKLKAAIAIQRQLLAAGTGDKQLGRTLASAYNNLAAAQADSDVTAASASYQQAIELQRQLLAGDQLNETLQSELARTYNNLGYLLSRHGRWGEALKCYREAIAYQDRLAATPQASAEFLRDAAVSHNNLGMALSSLGKLAEAEASFHKAIDWGQRVVTLAAGEPHALSDLGGMYNNLATLLDKLHRSADADPYYRRAIKFQRLALKAAPNNAAVCDLLAKHYLNYATNLGERRQFEKARKIVEQRRALAPRDPERLYSVAEQFTWLSAQVAAAGGAGTALEQQFVDSAVAALQTAVSAGLPRQRLESRTLASLAGRGEFQQLRRAPSSSSNQELRN